MFLFEELEVLKKAGAYASLPSYVENALNQRFKLRKYQKESFCNFITYFENESFRKYSTQVLFHMATGSGKTLIMAGLIVYLYKQGYRNFLFFVNLSNIIRKTKDNFLNSASTKYLFADEINIDGELIKVKEVDNFQGTDNDSINICFTTTQGLHSDLWNTKENSLTFDDFTNKKIVFISDEAHHLNADTKKGKLTEDEKDNIQSWEYTVNRVFGASKYNIMLEFTATCDLENKDILAKYTDKIIYDYPLKKFRKDGYSKEVQTLQADIPMMQRAIQATLLSQYRLKVFEEHGLNIKPVILFKSAIINESKEFIAKFIDEINTLTGSKIGEIAATATHPTIIRMFNYFTEKGITYDILANEIREEFNENRCISVNDEKEAEQKQIIVNSLEDSNNPYRAVFEVKKLDEGWDVLNLFDIVRLYETRDGKNGKPGKKTVQEAQLIGRGARYCPFILNDEQDADKRKYDDDIENSLRICEELYYHCHYDSKYISELKVALRENGMLPDTLIERRYVLKDDFKAMDFYKEGFVFFNERIEKGRTDVYSIPKSVKDKRHSYSHYTGRTETDVVLEDEARAVSTEIRTKTKTVSIREIAGINYAIVHKSLRRFDVFKFHTLKKYFPNLTSTREFITSQDYLGDMKVDITYSTDVITPAIYQNACNKMISHVASYVSSIEITYEGSKEFRSERFYRIFKDKPIHISDPKDIGHGVSQNADTIPPALKLDLSREDWYVFNDNYGTSEEKAFVKYFSERVGELEAKYSNIYLVRNERQLHIYSFDFGERFEPDYLLFLHKKNADGIVQYQIFIEPKGTHLIDGDGEKWKEALLLSLKKDAIPVTKFVDDKDYLIWGFPFFNRDRRMNEFDDAMKDLLV